MSTGISLGKDRFSETVSQDSRLIEIDDEAVISLNGKKLIVRDLIQSSPISKSGEADKLQWRAQRLIIPFSTSLGLGPIHLNPDQQVKVGGTGLGQYPLLGLENLSEVIVQTGPIDPLEAMVFKAGQKGATRSSQSKPQTRRTHKEGQQNGGKATVVSQLGEATDK